MTLQAGLQQIQELTAPQNEEFLNQGSASAPSAGAPIAVTSGTATWGSYAELVASLASESLLTHIHIVSTSVTVDEVITLEIATGAGGSEVALCTVIFEAEIQNQGIIIAIPKGLRIPAGTRIAARTSQATAVAHNVKVTLSTGISDMQNAGGGKAGILINSILNALVDANGAGSRSTLPVPNSSTGIVTPVTVTAGTGYASGSWAELVATNPADCIIDMLFLLESATVGTYMEFDIGIGSSGNEVAYRTVPFKALDANQLVIIMLTVPLFLPTGARLAARARGSAATAVDCVASRHLGSKLSS